MLNKPIDVLVLYIYLWFKISVNLSKDESLISYQILLFVHRTPIEI